MKTVSMTRTGRLTLPAEVRRKMRLDEEAQFEYEVDEYGESVTLRPVVAIRREDAWARTPEFQEGLKEALADAREGRVVHMTEQELLEYAKDS